MTFDLESEKVTPGQRALAKYIKAETGKVVKPESIALVDALRAAYRKDPAQVEERAKAAEAARARKREQFEKQLAKTKALAKSLGLELDGHFPDEIATEPEATSEATSEDKPAPDEFDESGEFEEEEEPEPPKARTKRPNLKVVEPAEATPADDEPLSPDIDVMESEDGWFAEGDGSDEEVEDF